jgi:phosphatidylinositol glycan class M
LGQIFDRTPGLHYTDIDYLVFSDAADHVLAGESPYLRPTYRYTPLLAFLLTPKAIFGDNFGKILFVLFDLLTGVLLHSCVSERYDFFLFLLWDFNPFTINISTRGNSDSLTAFLLVATFWLVQHHHLVASAVLYGIAVHLRIFPIFFVFTLFLKLKTRIIPFGFVSFSVFMVLNLAFFHLYGSEFLVETFLYHLGRKDYKHNFAAPWLPIYLGKDPTIAWSIVRLVLIGLLSIRFRNDIQTAWASITVCFIAFNPVCTVQYFDWAIALLGLIPERVATRRFLACFAFWLAAHLAWLGTAYLLEFQGRDVFYPLWAISCAIFVGNNALLWAITNPQRDKKEG